MRHTLTFILALLMASAAVGQNDLKKVAVWETKCSDGSITKFQSVMVRGGMEAAVANAPGYTGFDRAAFDQIIKEHNFQRSGAVNDNDIRRLGEMAGVQYIIVPEAMADGNDFYIIVKMLDVESGQYGAAYEELCTTNANDIKNACSRLASQLFGIPYNGSSSSSYSNTTSSNSTPASGWKALLAKMTTNVTTTTEDGGVHIGDLENAGLAVQYSPTGSLYCGGYGYDASTTTVAMFIAGDGYEINNCPGGWVHTGKYKDGEKNGEGMVYDRNGKLIYFGEFKNDKPVGAYPGSYPQYSIVTFNILDFPDGSVYIGELINNIFDGLGLYIWADGDAWWGCWEQGKQNGAGIYMHYNGEYETGTWKNGEKASSSLNFSAGYGGSSGNSSGNNTGGSLKLTDRPWEPLLRKATENAPNRYNNGSLLIGGSNTAGVYVWDDGTFYAGEIRDGNFNGIGMYITPTGYEIAGCPGGFVYVGPYKDDKKGGDYNGYVYDKEGNVIYKGRFKNDKPVDTYSSGEFIRNTYSNWKFTADKSSNGDIYVGETKNGKREGVGLYIWANGDSWIGNWKDGLMHGFGCYMWQSGSCRYGKWENGKRVSWSD